MRKIMERGGKRVGAGRKPGVPNKATAHIKALAQSHAPSALAELARLAIEAESEQARISAIKEILDRAYGKAPQPHDGDGEGGDIQHAIRITFVSAPDSRLTSVEAPQ